MWLVSLGPKAKLQQVMMTVAQKVSFELVPIDGPIGGFPDAQATAAALAEAIGAIPGLDRERLLLFGGWESATRGAGVTLQLVGERLGIVDQFQGVDQIELRDDGSFEVLERVEGGKHQVSVCAGAPAVLGWATGNLAEPRNNPQIGMANMRTIMPALQKAKTRRARSEWFAVRFSEPAETAADDARGEEHERGRDCARDRGMDGSGMMESILVLTHADESGAALSKGSLEAVTAGKELAARLGAELAIGIVARTAAGAAAQVAGAAKRVLAVEGEAFAQARFASDAAACEALCRAAQADDCDCAGELALCAGDGRGCASGGRSDRYSYRCAGHAHCRDWRRGSVEATRWFYRQRIEAVVSREKRPWFLLLDAGTHAAFAGDAGEAQVERDRGGAAGDANECDGNARAEAGRADDSAGREAAVCCGRGMDKEAAGWADSRGAGGRTDFDISCALRARRWAAPNRWSTRAAKGSSVLPFLTHLNQVGQTGSTPRHAKGLSTCCHGEEPHVVGWRFIGERRAVSLDPNCGWTRGKADVVYVADAFAVMAKVNAMLGKETDLVAGRRVKRGGSRLVRSHPSKARTGAPHFCAG